MTNRLQERLDEIGVTSTARYCGIVLKDRDWYCYHWETSLHADGRGIKINYYMGFGHIAEKGVQVSGAKGAFVALLADGTRRPLDAAIAERLVTPTAPSSSLIVEAVLSAGALDLTFEDWAEEFGLSSDSIKAKNAYEESARDEALLRFLLPEHWEELRELARDE